MTKKSRIPSSDSCTTMSTELYTSVVKKLNSTLCVFYYNRQHMHTVGKLQCYIPSFLLKWFSGSISKDVGIHL